jgi:uncharacterized membrane protein
MSNSSNIQQSKPITKRAIYSLVLGIISIVLPYVIIVYQAGVDNVTLRNLLWYGTGLGGGSSRLFLLGIVIAWICAIVGLIFGIKGLKSTKRKLAIAGITICTISLLSLMWLSLIWLMGGGPIYL